MRKMSRLAVFALLTASLYGCGSAETSGREPIDPADIVRWWETATPDYSFNPDRPLISLVGDNVVVLNIGDTYVDAGATANDLQDGDLTSQLVVDNPVDTNSPSDYLVRYTVTDSSQMAAFEAMRIVRVQENGEAKPLSSRHIGTTASHLGYIEHLPPDYGVNPAQSYPILIFNHGGGANASPLAEGGDDPNKTLGALLTNSGPALLIFGGDWQEPEPMIVLSPQMIDLTFDDPVVRFNAFLDFALSHYNIDESRVYISGWSAGAALSLAHAVHYSERVAAVMPIAGGLPLTTTQVFPNGYCDIQNVPIWSFHGEQDLTITYEASVENHELIINNCTPLVPPKLTIYQEADHFSHHATWNLSAMVGGSIGWTSDPAYDLYDQTIFDWMLSQSLDNRGTP
jgi:poly(3-hydroxybutyrate) depolymerase